MKENRKNVMILLLSLFLSMVVIYLSPRFDILTLMGMLAVHLILYLLLRLKDQKEKEEIYKKIEEVIELLHTLDPNKGHYEVMDDEFGKLRDEIVKIIIENKVLAEKSIENQEILREYTEDIAHQIKTPLTGAMLLLHLMEENPENAKDYIDLMDKSFHRLSNLVDTLLKMASLDSGMTSMKEEKMHLKQILAQIVKEMETYFKEKMPPISVFEEDFYIICDSQWTYEAIFNIIKNGLEASPKKGIEIHTKETSIYKSVIVKDFSEGLSNEELKNGYKRFHKKNSSTSGFGIGLPMAKSIMENQNGELLYHKNKDSNGFELRFYK